MLWKLLHGELRIRVINLTVNKDLFMTVLDK